MKKIILISTICVLSTQVFSQWQLTGNAGTNASTNFIGTTDNIALKVRTNNAVRMTVSNGGKVGIGITSPVGKLHVKGNTNVSQLMIDASSTQSNINPLIKLRNNAGNDLMWIHSDNAYNVFVGLGAGALNNASGGGLYNTFIGRNAGYSNTTGYSNTVSGIDALSLNTNGYENTANGTNALWLNTTASQNTAIGSFALLSQSFDNGGIAWVSANTAVGFDALRSNQPTETINGHYNTAVGHSALRNNTTGYENTANGYKALFSNITGSFNTANGAFSLISNTTGSANNAYGYTALFNNTTGNDNFATGLNALYSNTSASRNIAIGTSALAVQSYNPGFPWICGNVAIGQEALFSNQPISTGTGFYNTAVGTMAMRSNTTGYYNTGIGQGVLYSNTTGRLNTACGRGALNNNTEGIENTASGAFSLNSNITGSYNTANGYLALYSANSSDNTATGYHALYSTTNATRNTAMGSFAGSAYTNSSYNTFVGGYADANAAAHFNSSVMGDAAMITASSQVRLGDGGVNSIGGFVGWTTLPSDGRFKKNIQENVPGIEFISKLRPVTYTLDVHGVNQYIGANETGKESIYEEKSRIRYTGFIAQEVETAAKETGFDFSGVDAPKNNKDVYGLRYAEFVVPLVKAVQELSNENNDLKSEIEIIKSVLSSEQKQNFDKIKNENKSALEQNSPNPFNTQTEIKFKLPSTFSSAQLKITDANGKQVRNDILKSSSSVIINASEFSTGTYSYSLIVDGVNIDTKQMILTK